MTKEFVSGPILVSAYDIARHGLKQSQTRFATMVFLDSGGYEAGADADLSEVTTYPNGSAKWSVAEYEKVVSGWDFRQPTALVSFDTPDRREKLSRQIARAEKLAARVPGAASVFLLKPGPGSRGKLEIDLIIREISAIASFDVIGVTEKELGDSLSSRLLAVAKIRRALDSAGKHTPIHVFGSLDPVASPLFFICGADIFDGLTWIRYAYFDDMAVYRHNLPSRSDSMPPDIKDGELTALIHVQNYHVLGRLKDRMIQYLSGSGDFDVFQQHAGYFKSIVQRITAELKD